MKSFFSILSGVLLLFNGIGALFGGYHLIAHPDGSSLQMPLSMLATTPFTDFLIPGIILFVANGVSSVVVFTILALKYKNSPLLVAAQGAILTGWIIIQVLLIQGVHALHLIFGGVGLLLIICGWLLQKILMPKKSLK